LNILGAKFNCFQKRANNDTFYELLHFVTFQNTVILKILACCSHATQGKVQTQRGRRWQWSEIPTQMQGQHYSRFSEENYVGHPHQVAHLVEC